eukprot:gene4238-3062_t
MNHTEYVVGDPEVLIPPTSYLLTRTPGAFSPNDRVALTAYKKLLCMTTKSASDIRVVHRNGKTAEATLKHQIYSLTSTENYSKHPALFYGVGANQLVIINPNVQASGNFSITAQYSSFAETVFGAVAGSEGVVFVLTTHHIYAVDEKTGKELFSGTHQAKLTEGQSFDYHENAKIFALPSRNTLIIIDADTVRNADNKKAPKPWDPHSSPTSFARFFQLRNFSGESSDDVLILTAAERNTELRFWTFNRKSQRCTLKEEVTLKGGEAMGPLDFNISVTPSEEYVTLCSKTDALAVIIEIDRTNFKSRRITTWKIPDPSRACCAQMSKVCPSKGGVRMELFLTVRTSEGFMQVLVDESSIASANNNPADSPSNWFSGGSTGPRPVNQQRLTAVSSSLQGDCKALSTAAENNAANVVMEQAASITTELRKLDEDLMKIQTAAGQTMRVLESQSFEQMATKLGKEFATRNKSRLSMGGGTAAQQPATGSAEIGVMTESQSELLHCINQYTNSLSNITKSSCSQILTTLLEKYLVGALEKASESAMTFDGTGSSQLYFSDSNLTNSAQTVINNACSEIKGTLKKVRSEDQSRATPSSKELGNLADQYIAKYSAAVKKVHDELRETNRLMTQLSVPQAPPMDPSVILAKCISMGEAGDWAGALRAVLHASDFSVLLNFLESESCRANIKKITLPSTIELADFLSLSLQLSYRISAVPGAVPSRLEHLHMFLVEWDDYLQETKKRAANDDRNGPMFKLISEEMAKVLDELEQLDTKDLPRTVRTKHRLIVKIIAQLLI